jgi:hypothetical protein
MTLHEFVQLQIDEINRHKWIESEKAGYDLGDQAITDWVEHYACTFRRCIQESDDNAIEYPNGEKAPRMDAAATITCSLGCRRIA